MNEKYLWDKTGEDAEIEKLEQTLQVFRHCQPVPAALPAKVIPFEPRRRWRSFFQMATAFAACAILITLGLSLWLKTAEPGASEAFVAGQINSGPAQEIASPSASPAGPAIPVVASPIVVKAKAPAARKNFMMAYALERKPVKKSELFRPHNLTAVAVTPHIIEPEKRPVRLTKEEKFAYDQLMLALSITSSKLKIVKDTAEGVHQPNPSFSDKE